MSEPLLSPPGPPDFALDWERLAAYPWLQSLSGCPQDPVHHAEGDVYVHTRMVGEALSAMPAYRALPAPERRLVFAASLLHDVGKPDCTREEGGRISSRGHSRRGEILCRILLWRMGLPFAEREAIAALVRYHQIPFYALSRPDARRLVHQISQVARCDLLALVAEADMRGRVCADAQQILDNIALFVELCREEGCLFGPRAFPSAHSRFLYFRKPEREPDYLAHDDTFGEVVLLSGLPGVGKSYWIEKNLPDTPLISLDDIRRELGVSPRDDQGRVIQLAEERARELLRKERPFVWSATNLSRQLRASRINLFSAYRARVRIVYVEVPEEVLFRQNRQRQGVALVPPGVIEEMLNRWEVPDLTEAHQIDFVVRER